MSKPPQTTVLPPRLREPPLLPAKPTKPSKWWMLLLIIPAIATGLAVVASETLFKNFRRRWTNWQARLLGHLDLMGDNITHWSRRASKPVQIRSDFTSLGETIDASLVPAPIVSKAIELAIETTRHRSRIPCLPRAAACHQSELRLGEETILSSPMT
jgi:hypothetical protein